MKYIDIHSHLCLSDYPVDQVTVIANLHKNEVGTIIIGTTLEDSREVVKIAEQNDNIWACIGVHPKDGVVPIFIEEEFDKLVSHPKVVAIGECGLDYFKLEGDIEKIKEKQKEVFIQQIEFAIKHNKPLMIHARDSYDDIYDILNNYRGKVRGNMHFFAGSLEQARKFIDLGFTLSFTGVITFARNYDEIIKNIPLDKIQAETDAPFVAPVPYRGQKNEPSYVIEVYKKIAEIRGENVEQVRLQMLKNAHSVFGA
ncbi:MAG: TatD family hydrolase [Candidatus Paceibacterota bacterium]